MTGVDLPTKSWPASPWCPETKAAAFSCGIAFPQGFTVPIQDNTCNLKTSYQERISLCVEIYILKYLYLNSCVYISLYPYVCVCTHTHTRTQSECSLCFGNVLWLLALALNSTTIPTAPGTARSNRLHSTEGNSQTLIILVNLPIPVVVASSLILLSLLYDGLQLKGVLHHVIHMLFLTETSKNP